EGLNGRPPYPLSAMLRIHFMQQWFGLADQAMEEALDDIPLYRSFCGLAGQRSPDANTIMRFRHLLEKHNLGKKIFALVRNLLQYKGLMLREGTVVDATLIAAPPSTKNKDKACDPAMKQTKKGNQYYFGLKAHTGSDEDSGLVHTLQVTAANEHDVTKGNSLLHGDEKRALGDAGYRGVEKRSDAPPEVIWHIAMMRSVRKTLDPNNELDQLRERIEKVKSGIRSKVEFPFRVLKCQFNYRK
ncbi:IS5 family transposase, partial [Amphibiibacter pelophylacis]